MINILLLEFIDNCKRISRWKFIILLLAIFGVLWTGYALRVVGSREIVEPIHITIKSDQNAVAIPLVRLARSGVIVGVGRDHNDPGRWSIGGVFLDKIYLGVKKDTLAQIMLVEVMMGEQTISFSNEQLLSQWLLVDISDRDSYLKDSGDKSIDQLLLAPDVVRYRDSNLPLKKDFFRSLVNWSGDGNLIIAPFFLALKSFLILIFLSLVVLVLAIVYTKKYSCQLNPEKIAVEKRSFLIFAITLLAVIVALFLVNLLVFSIYHPDINLILLKAKELYLNHLMPSFVPKPVERLQFVFSVFVAPIFLLVFHYFIRIFFDSRSDDGVDRIYKSLMPFFIFMLFAWIFFGLTMSNFLYVRHGLFMGSYGGYLYALVFFPILLVISALSSKVTYLERIIQKLTYAIVGLIIFVLFFSNIFSIASTFDSFHFDPVFYPSTQVIFHKVLAVDMGSLYGLFPLFLNPVFNLFGLSILKFTIVMALLICISYLCLFYFLKFSVKNILILLSGFSCLFLYSYYGGNMYYQYWPIRFIFPCISILLTSIYLSRPRRLIYFLSFFIYALGILWNLETGIVVFVAWVLTLIYSDFNIIDKWGTFKKIGKHLIISLLFLIATAVIFFAYTYLMSGHPANLSLFFQYHQLFLLGYFLIPMPPFPHFWSIVALVYLSGLLYSLIPLFRSQSDLFRKKIFFLSILGIGLFSYYTGRSHDLTLIAPSYVAILMLILLADKLWSSIITSRLSVNASLIIFVGVAFYLFSATPSIFFTVDKISGDVGRGMQSLFFKNTASNTAAVKNVEFIKRHTFVGERILIISSNNYDGAYYGESQTVSVLNLPSSSDYFFKSEINSITDFLNENHSIKVFVCPDDTPPFDYQTAKIIRDKYHVEDASGYGVSLVVKNIN